MTLENPILIRELRGRMRGARAFWVLFAYLGILSVILFAVYLTWWRNNNTMGAGGAYRIGKEFFYSLFVVKALLVAAITPALTAGGVSIEKEQRTFDLLTISLLPRTSVVLGKLFAALGFVALLLTASLPLVSLGFILGGVAPDEVAIAYGLLLLTAFVYGSIGLACSSIAKNTTSATVMTYGIIAAVFFVTLPFAITSLWGGIGGNTNIGGLKAINPVGAVLAGIQQETYFGVVVPAWLTAVLFNGLFGVIGTTLAVHRLDWPRSDRAGLLRLLVAVFVGLTALAIFGMFLPGMTRSWGITDIRTVIVMALLVLTVLVPIFATADGLPPGNVFTTLLDPRRLTKGEAPSGVVYLLLLAVLCSSIGFVGARFGMNHADFVKFTPSLLRMTALLLATMFGAGTLGLLLTAALRSRTIALAALFGVFLITYFLPLAILSNWDSSSRAATIGDNIVYFCPLIAALDPDDSKAVGQPFSHHWLLFGKTPLSTASTILYTVSGLLFLITAETVQRKKLNVAPHMIVPAA